MATKIFNTGKHRVLKAWLDASTAVTSLRVALLMTNTGAILGNDGINTLSNISPLDEFDGANYTRQALSGGTALKDDTNDRANLDFADVLWTSLGASGTGRSIAGILLYDHIGVADTGNFPIAWLEFTAPKTPDGSNFTVNIADMLRLT